MTSLDDLLLAISRGPAATAPRLTHYDGAERIELSGRVLVNWVSKAANLLVEECDAGPGTVVALDLPPGHWRAAYWALAAWACGATLDVSGAADSPDVVVSDRPGDSRSDTSGATRVAVTTATLVAVTTAALARSFPGDLPAGALDEAATLSTYGDVFDAPQSAADDDVALRTGGADVTFADLVPSPEDARVLLVHPRDQAQALRTALAVWAGGGSLVVTRTDLDDAALEHLLATEQAGLPEGPAS